MPPRHPLLQPAHFTNRELSWLEFNQRVLEEALDPLNPLLERLKFLCIVSSNLDEFFEIRVGGIKQQIENETGDSGPDGLSPSETFAAIHQRVTRMVDEQYNLWNNDLLPLLAQHNICFPQMADLDPADREWLRHTFFNEIYPVLTPLAIDPSHPFPQLLNKSLNLVCTRAGPDGTTRYAIVQVPRVISRLIELPRRPPGTHHFLFLGRAIKEYIGCLFPGEKILGAHLFRVTRNSDLYIDEEEVLNLLRSIEEELRNRNKGNAVRLEVEDSCPTPVIDYLLEKFRLGPSDLYVCHGPLNLLRLMPVASLPSSKELKYPSFTPVTPQALRDEPDLYDVLRRHDVLLHHPYESFGCLVDFVERAAADPRVLAIKMTLYRTSGDSPIVKALIEAANAGKQVTVVVELKARFDEANNIAWARQMEEAGIHVVYGLVGLKTHCKLLMIVRRDDDGLRHYCHLGTGNYHSRTARLYTDLGLLTARPELTAEVAGLFNAMTGMAHPSPFQHLLVAPFELKARFLDFIRAETANARKGLPASIFAKMNSLVDEDIILALYEASGAGVHIDLMVRGICCLRPGIPGVSECIHVTSIVDQYLEHSRIFVFHNNGQPLVYLGSADWMPRNLLRRIEVVFPVLDPHINRRIREEILGAYRKDTLKTRIHGPDGRHTRRLPPDGTPTVRAQGLLMELATQQERAAHASPAQTQRLIPLRKPPAS